jgi:hypothetical protein
MCLGLLVLGSCGRSGKVQGKGPQIHGNQYIRFTLKAECDRDPDIAVLQQKARQHGSILHLLRHEMEVLEIDPDPQSTVLTRLNKLFTCGRVSDRIEDYHYGITVYLKAGNHPYGGFLNQLWGKSLADASPWDGKSFTPMSSDEVLTLTDGVERGEIPTFRGINGFKTYDESLLNRASMAVLSFWLDLKVAPEGENRAHGYHKKGGHFIAHRAKSLTAGNRDNDVFQLNYRWRKLKNPVPIRYLIDEIVQVAEGLYFGPLLLATHRLMEDFNPDLDPEKYNYQNFGYFILMDEDWLKVKESAFP